MYAEIKNIKTVSQAKKVWEALTASYTQRVGERSAKHHDAMFQDGAYHKAEGLAWWKDRCRSVAQNLVQNASVVNHFIPASSETDAWGGFLGGERLVYTNQAEAADMEAMIGSRISGL